MALDEGSETPILDLSFERKSCYRLSVLHNRTPNPRDPKFSHSLESRFLSVVLARRFLLCQKRHGDSYTSSMKELLGQRSGVAGTARRIPEPTSVGCWWGASSGDVFICSEKQGILFKALFGGHMWQPNLF